MTTIRAACGAGCSARSWSRWASRAPCGWNLRRSLRRPWRRLGGLDLAVLGLGPNGHLGFNEPPSLPDAPTRTLALTPASLESNRAYWGELAVPEGAITAGMDVILAARQTLLLVGGTHKRAVLHAALEGPETPEVPASFLRRTALTVIADEAAWA